MNTITAALAATTIVVALAIGLLPARADWQPVRKTETYSVTGKTGIDLYRSIGEHGPKAGAGRAIAYTTFDLKWSRKYVPERGGCMLASAKPHLIIITKVPKPANALPAELKQRWSVFIAGIEAHERVHGDIIVEMVKAIEKISVGFSVPDDPDCKKIRVELTKKLAALSEEQRRRSRDFDRAELTEGGNVHALVLALVNGD